MIKHLLRLLGTTLLAAGSAGYVGAAAKPKQPVCVLVQVHGWKEQELNPFLDGIRKTFAKETLPVSAFDGHGHWHGAGKIDNAFRLVGQCPSSKIADSLGYRCVDAEHQGEPANYVWISFWSIDFEVTGEQYTGLAVDVALFAPESLGVLYPPRPGQHSWVQKSPTWPSTKRPGMVSQGEMVGLAALEVAHQQLDLLPASNTLLRHGK